MVQKAHVLFWKNETQAENIETSNSKDSALNMGHISLLDQNFYVRYTFFKKRMVPSVGIWQ